MNTAKHATDAIEQARFNMIEQQIRPWDVHAPDVLELLKLVKRECYVPPTQRALAFVDTELPIGDGQTMLAPRVEARILQALQLKPHEQVLQIGVGSGYLAALLAYQAHTVTAIEIKPNLTARAAATLQENGVVNVRVVQGNGLAYSPTGPWDVIVLSGAVAKVPEKLLMQLKIGGRLAAIVGQLPVMQMQVITRTESDCWRTKIEFETVAPMLLGGLKVSNFQF